MGVWVARSVAWWVGVGVWRMAQWLAWWVDGSVGGKPVCWLLGAVGAFFRSARCPTKPKYLLFMNVTDMKCQ